MSKTKSLVDKLGSGTVYNLVGNAVAGIFDVLIMIPLILNASSFTVEQVAQIAAQLLTLHASISTLTSLGLVVVNNRYKLF